MKRAILGFVLCLSVALGCSYLTAQHKEQLAMYQAEQDACIAATPHDRAAIDACRAKVKADYCGQWANDFDAGVCQ